MIRRVSFDFTGTLARLRGAHEVYFAAMQERVPVLARALRSPDVVREALQGAMSETRETPATADAWRPVVDRTVQLALRSVADDAERAAAADAWQAERVPFTSDLLVRFEQADTYVLCPFALETLRALVTEHRVRCAVLSNADSRGERAQCCTHH